MAQVEITESWRTDVCAVLATGKFGSLINWTLDAKTRYDADSNAAWSYELYEALIAFLSSSQSTGCQIDMQTPARKTYEFIFPFKGSPFYGKLLLREDRRSIVIFSAHRPRKAKLSCD